MKRSTLVFSLIAALATLIFAPGAPAQLSLGDLQKNLASFQESFGKSLGSLKDLKKFMDEPERLRSSVDDLLKNFDSLNSKRGGMRSFADDVTRSGADSLNNLSGQMARVSDPKEKKKLTKQYENARKSLDDTITKTRAAQQDISSYLDRLGGFAEKVKLDPSATGVQSLADSLAPLIKDGSRLFKSLGDVTKSFGGVTKNLGSISDFLPKI